MKRTLFGAILSLLLVAASFGQNANSITVADDSSSGTYKQMVSDLNKVCSDYGFDVNEMPGAKGGAVGNLNNLLTNHADAAFLHSDVFFAGMTGDTRYARLRTLIALYPEPIHVLVLRNSKTKKNWVQTVTFNTLEDLKGYKVGAAGGGAVTARILQGNGQAGFADVVEFGTGKEVIPALDNGTVDAAIFVGAQPLPNIDALPNKSNYKLIPIGENISTRVSTIYRSASINYTGLTNGTLRTLAPVAVILTRVFALPTKVAAQQGLRACFERKLPELKDTASPNWQDVESATDPGTLNNYLVLPASSSATTPRRR